VDTVDSFGAPAADGVVLHAAPASDCYARFLHLAGEGNAASVGMYGSCFGEY
jgi:hypothetical protein